MRSALLLLVLAVPALAARPVGRPVRGSLDERVVAHDAVGVLVRFQGVSKAEVQPGLDALSRQLGLEDQLLISFFKTPKATLAAVYPQGVEGLTVKRLRGLAAALSGLKGALNAWAFVYPAPDDETLEVEAWWRYHAGESVEEARLAFRDDENWSKWTRRKLTDQELELKKWPDWPLSHLCLSLGVPGRAFFEGREGLISLAVLKVPVDLGPNLMLLNADLPSPTVLEIQQLAEAQQKSVSRLIEDALVAAETAKQLGFSAPEGQRAPWDDGEERSGKTPSRELELLLTARIFLAVEARAEALAVRPARVVEAAWRRAHSFAAPKK